MLDSHKYKQGMTVKTSSGEIGYILKADTWFNNMPAYHLFIDNQDKLYTESQIERGIK